MNFPYGHLSYNRKAKIVKWIVKSHLAFVQKNIPIIQPARKLS